LEVKQTNRERRGVNDPASWRLLIIIGNLPGVLSGTAS